MKATLPSAGFSIGLWLLLALAVVTAPGCSGCNSETPQERAAREKREEEEAEKRRLEREKKKKKPPIEVAQTLPQPNNPERPALLVKPGHWMTGTQRMKANYEDWVGQGNLQMVDKQNHRIPIDRTAFTLRSTRDLALSKDQEKQLETTFFVPAVEDSLRWRSSLLARRGVSLPPTSMPVNKMAPHQHHFVVLAAEPRRYAFIDTTYVVRAHFETKYELPTQAVLPFDRQYRVVAPALDKLVPLPDNPLCWSTVAYIVWDEVDPEQLSIAQRSALVDWIHWGGQLLVSGPDSLDLLRDCFLTPYLPADGAGARTITADDLAPLSKNWKAAKRPTPLTPVADWSGVNLKLRPEGISAPGAGDLFAERRVGRGRILVSAMQLAERDLINWSSGYENLLNNLILRRPARKFAWDDGYFGNALDADAGGRAYVLRPKNPGQWIPADTNSKLHYFTRDTHNDTNATKYRLEDAKADFATGGFGGVTQGDFEMNRLAMPAVPGGPAAWNDFNATATAARGTLREAAGVNVPSSTFVVACLAIYLTVLAPFNWFLFRALGRVELAWVAAPIIALAGTWVVVRQAQLDIGFVRAQTEVAVLETQPDHPRGCLTRYMSFYTSLSTTYDLEFDDPTTLAAPFARTSESPLLAGEQPRLVTYQRQEKARLLGLTVSSNSTDMAHCEQMFDLGGALQFDGDKNQLVNQSEYDLKSLVIVRRPESDAGRGDSEATLQGCWIGDLGQRTSTSVSFSPLSSEEGGSVFADRRAGETGAEERLNLEPLFALALKPLDLEPGDVRAVARIDAVMPGVSVTPRASQLRGATLLVAHLKYGPLPTPSQDENAPRDEQRRP